MPDSVFLSIDEAISCQGLGGQMEGARAFENGVARGEMEQADFQREQLQ